MVLPPEALPHDVQSVVALSRWSRVELAEDGGTVGLPEEPLEPEQWPLPLLRADRVDWCPVELYSWLELHPEVYELLPEVSERPQNRPSLCVRLEPGSRPSFL